MLNFIALRLVGWAVHGPLMEAGGRYPQSEAMPDAAMLPRLAAAVAKQKDAYKANDWKPRYLAILVQAASASGTAMANSR